MRYDDILELFGYDRQDIGRQDFLSRCDIWVAIPLKRLQKKHEIKVFIQNHEQKTNVSPEISSLFVFLNIHATHVWQRMNNLVSQQIYGTTCFHHTSCDLWVKLFVTENDSHWLCCLHRETLHDSTFPLPRIKLHSISMHSQKCHICELVRNANKNIVKYKRIYHIQFVYVTLGLVFTGYKPSLQNYMIPGQFHLV